MLPTPFHPYLEEVEHVGHRKGQCKLQETCEVIVVDESAGGFIDVVLLGVGKDLLPAGEVLKAAIGCLEDAQIDQCLDQGALATAGIKHIGGQGKDGNVGEELDPG